ncbi:MAG: hypothetical protein KKG47_01215 [Proteobacteria bacterium]|nr:hypothetical protein [Pseudomonadota bacterium]MBU1736686.1 hypothetical protein [Pseudomonadota bacterium]
MKKTLSVILIGSMLIAGSVGPAVAGDHKKENDRRKDHDSKYSKGQPFAELQAQINALQDRLDGLALIPGPQGEQGEIGPMGPMGPAGPAGADGLTGPVGADGPPGAIGPEGPQGPQGLPGVDGLNGRAGINGVNGRNGLACWDLDGDDVPDTNEDINSDGFVDALDCQGGGSAQVIADRVLALEQRLADSDLDGDGFSPASGDCNDADSGISPAGIEVVDGMDNDCNGVVDDCSGFEICDGVDNDCDGAADEDFNLLGNSCSDGMGACRRTGEFVCSADGNGETCNATAAAPSAERCDGIDNDCDGVTDEGIPSQSTGICCRTTTRSYSCGFLGLSTCYETICVANYTSICINGQMQQVCY